MPRGCSIRQECGMSLEAWYPFLEHAGCWRGDGEVVLEPAAPEAGLRQIAPLLTEPRFALIPTILRGWQEQGSEALLTTIPQLLNPTSSFAELNPTGQPMRDLFPDFCDALDHTAQFALIIIPAHEGESVRAHILCAG